MGPKYLDLKIDQKLTNANFAGYKLSLEPIPVFKKDLGTRPHRIKPTKDQYSFLQVELLTMHNHLVQDPWHDSSSYFIALDGSILEAGYNECNHQPKPFQRVYKFQNFTNIKPESYNCSFHFVSEKYCVFCNGDDEIVLFNTGDRKKTNDWKAVYQTKISDKLNGFLLRDSRVDIVNENEVISLAFQHVSNDGKSFINNIFWCIIKYNSANQWEYEIKNILHGRGALHYCAFELKSQSLIICSNKSFHLRDQEDIYKEKKDNECEEKYFSKVSYAWSQTDEDITIKFPHQTNKSKDDFSVMYTRDHITVKCLEETFLEGSLFSIIIPDLTTWSLNDNILQIVLQKEESDVKWSYLIENGPKETIQIENILVSDREKPIVNLEADIEDCDFPAYAGEEGFSIVRINLSTGETTHKINLSSSPIFTTSFKPGLPPAIVTRQDFDALLFRQQYNPANPEEWNLHHESILHAFGFVQASKQQKKFIGCSPDSNYAVISESHRFIFIYCTKYESAGCLRNRNGPQVPIGKQHLITLDDSGEVLGMNVSNNFITLLTEQFVIHIQLKTS